MKLFKNMLKAPSLRSTFYALFLIGFTSFLYYKGLNGPFLFDDYNNLQLLGRDGGISNFSTWLNFVFSGASALGRPISFASFTLNAQSWPADPFWFKITNLIIHLVNGVLIYYLINILPIKTRLKTNQSLALLIALMWLVNPIQLTSVLYVVQRMNSLATLFMLMGLIGYVKGRLLLNRNIREGYIVLTLSISVFTILATLTKETGILLPLYAVVLSITLLQNLRIPNLLIWRAYNFVYSVLPYILVVTYYIYNANHLDAIWNRREFGMLERLMTESRILFVYLKSIVIPDYSVTTLFNAQIEVSKSLVEPVTTLIASLLILISAVFSYAKRREYPIIAFGLLWFYCGHLLESTFLPLELYFIHRNYMPSIGVIFTLCFLIFESKYITNQVKVIITIIYIFLLSFITHSNSNLWSNKFELLLNWGLENRNSVRAQHEAANAFLHMQNSPQTAMRFLNTAYKNHPESISTRLRLIETQCYLDNQQYNYRKLLGSIEKLPHEFGAVSTTASIRRLIERGDCPYLTMDDSIFISRSVLSNPRISFEESNREFVHLQIAKAFKFMGDYSLAIQSLTYDNSARLNFDYLVLLAECYFSLNNHLKTLTYVNKAEEEREIGTLIIDKKMSRRLDILKQKIKDKQPVKIKNNNQK